MSAFLPNPDSKASRLFDYVTTLEPGDVVTYAQLGELCGVDMANGPAGTDWCAVFSKVVHTVNARLHATADFRHLQSVPTVGYRVGDPAELRAEALSRLNRATRQQSKALQVVEKTVRHPDATVNDRRRVRVHDRAHCDSVSGDSERESAGAFGLACR